MVLLRNIWESEALETSEMSTSRPIIRVVPDPPSGEPAALEHAEPVLLPERDVRAKRPPMLSFLLRWATMRRVARVVTLVSLDLAGVFLAILTALLLKLSLIHI